MYSENRRSFFSTYISKRLFVFIFQLTLKINFKCVFVGEVILLSHLFQLPRDNWVRVLKVYITAGSSLYHPHPRWVCQKWIMIPETFFSIPLLVKSLFPFIKFVKQFITLVSKPFFLTKVQILKWYCFVCNCNE